MVSIALMKEKVCELLSSFSVVDLFLPSTDIISMRNFSPNSPVDYAHRDRKGPSWLEKSNNCMSVRVFSRFCDLFRETTFQVFWCVAFIHRFIHSFKSMLTIIYSLSTIIISSVNNVLLITGSRSLSAITLVLYTLYSCRIQY